MVSRAEEMSANRIMLNCCGRMRQIKEQEYISEIDRECYIWITKPMTASKLNLDNPIDLPEDGPRFPNSFWMLRIEYCPFCGKKLEVSID